MSVQDAGRFGMLRHVIGECGPMDRSAFGCAGSLLPVVGIAGLEFTQSGLDFSVDGSVEAAFAGGEFRATVNGAPMQWPGRSILRPGSRVSITAGSAGNYGYVRLSHEIAVEPVLGSRSTNTVAQLGGVGGRSLTAGDSVPLGRRGVLPVRMPQIRPATNQFRVVWGIHADLFAPELRRRFVESAFAISPRLDRMGVRLADGEDVFVGAEILSLVSDALVAGDIQILGDGTPIVLMRDHPPTGGYPRIATIVFDDLDGFAQMRPGTMVRFEPVSPHRLGRRR